MMWIIWKARNLAVFEGKKRNIYGIIQQIILTVQAPYLGLSLKNSEEDLLGPILKSYFPVVSLTVHLKI